MPPVTDPPARDPAASTNTPAPPAADGDRAVTIVLGGDLGFGGSGEPTRPDGAVRHGQRYAFETLTAALKPLIDGDLNFANLETVVSDRQGLSPQSKAFNFRTHPAGLRHLVGLGFNMLSVANNHAADYGDEGVWETLRNLEAAEDHGLKAWHGLGIDRDEALQPAGIMVKGARIAFSAVGIGGRDLPRNGERRAGMLSYARDFDAAVSALSATAADLRVLSVHYGAELQVRPSAADVRKLRDEAAMAHAVDLVVGHHAHVAAGVQLVDGRLVFYGLGNLLHQGMQDMGRFNACRDYGLLARVHLYPETDGRLLVRAVEAVPLTNMHLAARPMAADEARVRVEVLNHLAAGLNDPTAGATGLRFTPQADGRGLHCLPGAGSLPGRIGALCGGWQAPAPAPPQIARRVSSACGGAIEIARDTPLARGHRSSVNGGKRSPGTLVGSLRQRSQREPAWSLYQQD